MADHTPSVPRPCQNEQKTPVTSGQSRTPQTASDLGKGRLTRCVKRPSKQPVTLRELCLAELRLRRRLRRACKEDRKGLG